MLLAIRTTYHLIAKKSTGPSRLLISNSVTRASYTRNFHYTDALAARYLSINIAVVGSGPAGFYTTQKLLKEPRVNVDIYEKLPVPFGLVRYGVAPDHQDVKNVINSFSSVAKDNRVNFYGNVNLGQDILLDDLINSYHAVILCYGSAQDKLLQIEGEDSKNTISARNFVGWYNGVPEDKDLDIDLDCDTACIIGQGNVALDCARILLRPANLDKTDITSYSQKVLSKSKVKKIYIIGRRGPIQASFTIKELRELIKMNGAGTNIDPETVFQDYKVTQSDLTRLSRSRKRLTELLLNLSANRDYSNIPTTNSNGIECRFKFFAKPLRINSDFKTGRVCQLELQRTEYFGVQEFLDEKALPVDVDEYETIDCGLIIRSIGYKATMIDSKLPKDIEKGALLNSDGRVHGFSSLYCSGWLATGASGVIAGTLNSSIITAKSVLDDINSGSLVNVTRKKPGSMHIMETLSKRKKQIVHFNDWLRIDEFEKRLGALVGKNREKIVDVDQMLKVASGMQDGTVDR